ncbi:radical SAM protein [Micromonospora sp. WMMA1949]|uniref:B12-binding domain-containing radical SAM protein n=1 Tax=unclassified Micromonospora TaxID=2617518 RepID=UPI0022B70B2D|nr:cobalamin-dependent protein [Micromonospora sp. WMMA1949]MCZ7428587.1 radical SAM protein [Micromonospora sp. WMMA1949]
MKMVTLVELTAFEKIVPLASGYLCGYARLDPEVDSGYEFRIYDGPVTLDRDAVLADLVALNSAVYGFSCYVWNMGLVRWLLAELLARRPDARCILGGPQVMSHAHEYVPDRLPNVVVCNGEGEKTFQRYLRELLNDEPDLSAVPGISFWRDDELVTTERPERIKELSEIPSPYTSGLYEPGKYTFAILETNRGCPYNCGFCFWGAATNAKVNRFETERVLDDITWMSETGCVTIFLADANWGMAPRDVEFTRHMLACRERTGFPMVISMNAAKNKPERVAEITKLLVQGGMLTSQPISLQTMDSGVLKLIDRSNIRAETYTALQRTLREQNISSYIEMIWPLPGETVASFREGITALARARADTILVYPQMLLHNTPIYENRERYGISLRRVDDVVAEADIVVGTRWVTEDDYHEGSALYYAVHALYSLRGLYYLANHLDRSGQITFGDLYAEAARYFAGRVADSPICRFIDESVHGLGNYYLLNGGRLAHLTLHAERDHFTRLLTDFVRTQPFWSDADARAMFELDLLARPYIYRETPAMPDYPFTELDVRPRDDGFEVTTPELVGSLLSELDMGGRAVDGPLLLRHPVRHKLPYLRHRTLDDNISYCQGMTLHLREMLPEWTPAATLSETPRH